MRTDLLINSFFIKYLIVILQYSNGTRNKIRIFSNFLWPQGLIRIWLIEKQRDVSHQFDALLLKVTLTHHYGRKLLYAHTNYRIKTLAFIYINWSSSYFSCSSQIIPQNLSKAACSNAYNDSLNFRIQWKISIHGWLVNYISRLINDYFCVCCGA